MKNIMFLFLFLLVNKFSFAVNSFFYLPDEVIRIIIYEVINVGDSKIEKVKNEKNGEYFECEARYQTYDFIKKFNTILDESANSTVSIFELMNAEQDDIIKISKRLLNLALVNRRFFSIVWNMILSDRSYEESLSEVIDHDNIDKFNKKLDLKEVQKMSFLTKIYLVGIELKPDQLAKLLFLHPFLKSVDIIECGYEIGEEGDNGDKDNNILSYLFHFLRPNFLSRDDNIDDQDFNNEHFAPNFTLIEGHNLKNLSFKLEFFCIYFLSLLTLSS